MPLTKTTEVPPGNADTVLNLECLKMVVVVNDLQLVTIADDLAKNPPIADRQVIWFKNGLPAHYQGIFNITGLATALAFSLSVNNQVKNVIRAGEIIDFVRVESAYTKAGL